MMYSICVIYFAEQSITRNICLNLIYADIEVTSDILVENTLKIIIILEA